MCDWLSASLKVVAWAYTVSGLVSVSSARLLDGLADGPELESPITEQREAASCRERLEMILEMYVLTQFNVINSL